VIFFNILLQNGIPKAIRLHDCKLMKMLSHLI